LSDRKLKPLPPDPFRHQDSAIALQTPVRRAFIAVGPEVPMNIFVDFAFARKRLARKPILRGERYVIWRVLTKIAKPVGRVGRSHATLWRLNAK
jgi:hypothetical protein